MKKAIIKINTNLSQEARKAVTERIYKEWKENGIVVVSNWCDVYIVDDAELVGGES